MSTFEAYDSYGNPNYSLFDKPPRVFTFEGGNEVTDVVQDEVTRSLGSSAIDNEMPIFEFQEFSSSSA